MAKKLEQLYGNLSWKCFDFAQNNFKVEVPSSREIVKPEDEAFRQQGTEKGDT